MVRTTSATPPKRKQSSSSSKLASPRRRGPAKKRKSNLDDDEPIVKPFSPGWPVSSGRPLNCLSCNSKNLDQKENNSSDENDCSDGANAKTPSTTTDSAEGRRLRPGSCLSACSGCDVQLARGATARPNLSKGKGRFLFVMPGQLSLSRPQTGLAASSLSTPAKNDTVNATTNTPVGKGVANVENEDSTPARKSAETDVPAAALPSPSTVKVPAAVPSTLGSVENLDSESPVLRVPFSDGRVLCFNGKKVDATSKFMALSCKGGKGTVACKDIFSQLVVFGEAEWENTGTLSNETCSNLKDKTGSISHFGGSVRTIDGGRPGSTKRRSRWNVHNRSRKISTTPSSGTKKSCSLVEDETSDEVDESSVQSDESMSDDEEYVSRSAEDVSGTPAPKRSSRSCSRKVNYADVLESEEEEDGRESDVSVQENKTAAKNNPNREGSAPKSSSKECSRQTERAKKKNQNPIVIDDEQSSDSSSEQSVTISSIENSVSPTSMAKKLTMKSPRRRRRSPKKSIPAKGSTKKSSSHKMSPSKRRLDWDAAVDDDFSFL